MGNLTFLYSLEANNYLFDIRKLMFLMLTNLKKICYISLNKSGESLEEFCKENKINLENVLFIDLVSSRFKKCSSKKGIFYLEVTELEKELKNIVKIVEKNHCDSIILDSLSTMPIYYSENEFLKFAHELLVYTESKHIITNLIIQKKDLEKEWANSLIPLVGRASEINFN